MNQQFKHVRFLAFVKASIQHLSGFLENHKVQEAQHIANVIESRCDQEELDTLVEDPLIDFDGIEKEEKGL
jgi:hypothetical protein